ncbi:outer membrane beta-barrel protein [Flavobacterium frigoris]|uniref:Putative beta-barrel porin-2, OmpL-like. bbp2 n=2 Tax=Flavobacterium frigoris TaxID=229204 RepID=A0A1H9J262_FLAFI|nr:outer membrane beta-barrel protein [Flavobacterium frigoris]SEQ80970.1 Putative beta-barrel porin-2, OmpL-like. bbp2 [Flavobacterium frigoris]
MMMKKVIVILALALTGNIAFAQDTPLEISGSADVYYKYDFAKKENIGTSFATDQNSVSLGMLDIALKKTTGKASFVGEVSFGPRGQFQSIPNGDGTDGNTFHIQNLYATYAATEKLSFTAGYMGTFIGYEVISPLANFHYSTSYLFTNGPFQNAGVKVNYSISDKVGIMVGAFNDSWNSYKADPIKGLNAFGAQLSIAPSEGISAYLNFMDGSVSGTIIDLTASFKLADKFKLGLNAADFSNEGKVGYTGLALYPAVDVTEKFSLGLRGEYFKFKEGSGDDSVTALTLTANLKTGGLTFIPELRLDNGSNEIFEKSNGNATKSASQFALAMVYGF